MSADVRSWRSSKIELSEDTALPFVTFAKKRGVLVLGGSLEDGVAADGSGDVMYHILLLYICKGSMDPCCHTVFRLGEQHSP